MNATFPIAEGAFGVDLKHQGHDSLIATAVFEVDEGVVLVDPGPVATLGTLEAGLRSRGLHFGNVTGILLTHVHLDHAGATGDIVALNPRISVHVHERGARHLVQPERLLESARMVFGPRLEELWGISRPVPCGNVRVASDHEVIDLCGRKFRVAATPGHARHHNGYLDLRTGTACVGEATGIRLPGSDYVMPPTPPPDVDTKVWRNSVEKIAAWRPARLYLPHFGVFADVERHLFRFADELAIWQNQIGHVLQFGGGTDREHAVQFEADLLDRLVRKMPAEVVRRYQLIGDPQSGWLGLARYLRVSPIPAVLP